MIGLIGGTGLDEALVGRAAGREHVINTPYGATSGPIRVVEWDGVELAILARHGEGHAFPPSLVPYRANIYALKTLGVTHVIASGAVGSLRDEIKPRDLVLVDQFIDKTYRRSPTFFDTGLAVHVELAQPCCPILRALLQSAAPTVSARVHPKGTYVCIEGPSFSTAAESHLHRAWGADVVGMTALPEARLAREAEMCYALVALATDYDCWRPHDPHSSRQTLLPEIVGHLKEATANAVALLRAAVEALAVHPPEACACHTALDLAVWSDRRRLRDEVSEHYGPLLKRYVQNMRDDER